jgi:hypothetical protein
MQKRESSFSITLRHWVMANAHRLETATFEVKQTTTNALPFNALEEHQENFSDAIKYSSKGVFIRVEAGTVGCPDYIFLKQEPAFIVAYYSLYKAFVIIDIDTWKLEKSRSKRKSLSFDRAQAISWETVLLKK